MASSFINFKDPQDVTPSAIIVASLVILAGTLGYMLLVPAPSAAGMARMRERNLRKIEGETNAAKESAARGNAVVNARVWEGDSETVMSQVLAQITTRAQANRVQVSAFRPQRQQTIGTLTELPFSVQISGPYPAVLRLAEGLNDANGRMVLRSLQFASANGANSSVSGSLGLSVYVPGPVAPPTTSRTSRTGGATGG